MNHLGNESETDVDAGAENAAAQRGTTSFPTKVARALVAIVALGSAAAYGAITVKPELVNYLSFVPGLEASNASMCTTSACGSSTAVTSACCGEACGACPAESAVGETTEVCESAACSLCPSAACPTDTCPSSEGAASSTTVAEDSTAGTEL